MLKHVTSVNQLKDKALLNQLFKTASYFQKLHPNEYPKTLENKIIATLFFEPSTRTRFSFEAAVYKLGGNVITNENGSASSSAVKGEIIEDTIRVVNGYADGIIMRHPTVGSAAIAANYTKGSFINAGDGMGDHPTQALLDLYTIQKIKDLDGLCVTVVGDLLNGRTVHALLTLLSMYKNRVNLVSPPELALQNEYIKMLKDEKVEYKELTEWSEALKESDVVYVTRVQKERFNSHSEYEKCKDAYILDSEALKLLKKDAIILHPLPRVNEISKDVDNDSRARYFEQAENGLYARMALLHYLFGGKMKT